MITLNHIQRVIQMPEETQLFLSAISDWHLSTCPGTWRPALDVYEVEDSIVVRMEIAGMREADFTVTLSHNKITFSGCRLDHSEKKAYHRMEIFFGEFQAEIEITQPFHARGAEAFYADGFLKIILPKGE